MKKIAGIVLMWMAIQMVQPVYVFAIQSNSKKDCCSTSKHSCCKKMKGKCPKNTGDKDKPCKDNGCLCIVCSQSAVQLYPQTEQIKEPIQFFISKSFYGTEVSIILRPAAKCWKPPELI